MAYTLFLPKVAGRLLARSTRAPHLDVFQANPGTLSDQRTVRLYANRDMASYSSIAAVTESADRKTLSRFYDPDYCEAIAKIMRIRQDYIENRMVFIPGKTMRLFLVTLGASLDDLATLQSLSEKLGSDPTLSYRKIRSGRFCVDYDAKTIRRLEHRPFVLSVAEGFKRFDSGQPRIFEELEDDVQQNTVFQALLSFKAILVHGVHVTPRPLIDYSQNRLISRAFHIRTTTSPELLGHPASEGIHSDGADHVMSTFLSSFNLATDGGATYVHDVEQTSGVQVANADPLYVLGRVRHQHPLDTLVIIDHERKHSLSPVYPRDPTRNATRDMFVWFTRGLPMEGHISKAYDTTVAHQRLDMEIPLQNPT